MERFEISGTKVVIKETKGPGIVSGTIFIKGGSVEDPEGKKGLTNLALKLLLKGSKNYDAFSINKFFEDSGGYITSSASEEVSSIEFSVKSEDFEKAVKIIVDIIQNPMFPEDKLKIEVDNVKAQIKAKKEEGISFAFDKLRSDVFKGTPYEFSSLGKEEDLDNIKISDLRERWKQLYSSERFVISIVGDLPLNVIKKAVSNFKIPSGDKPKYSPVNFDFSGKACKTYSREGSQATILMLYPAPPLKSEDYFKFRVLNSILGNGFTSKLFQELREKKGYAYAVGSTYNPRFEFGTLVSYIGTSPQKTEDAINDMRDIISRFLTLISGEDLNTAKEKIVGDFLMSHQTRAKQSYYLGWFELIGLGYGYDEKFPEIIKAVSLEDVVSVYNRYMTNGSFCIVVKP